jgi:FtsP/CotA-like multicopper oxidase with cupredoxin domain
MRTVVFVLLLLVLPCLNVPGAAEEPRTRQYYLAAEEVQWDYAPSRRNLLHGAAHPSGIPAPWTHTTRQRKVRYIEYTDNTFTTRKPQPDWLGILGPVIRAEVGDTILVHFLNRSKGRYGIHPHGVRYTKEHEGAVYAPMGAGARIPPGGRFTYTWVADEGSGPGPGDPSSLVWWYHSHVDEPVEVNRGLLGPLIVTARGKARADATPMDVGREFVTLFMIFNENREGDEKNERGLMHTINGFIFANLPGLVMKEGERVRWYLLGMGNEVDLHTAHWHGKTLRFQSRNTDVIELLPGSMATADMVADNPGTWLLHCHVGDHMHAGMAATYTISPAP